MRNHILILLLLLFASFGVNAQAESRLYTLEHDGLERTAQLYIPSTTPTSLVIVLHPFFSSGRAIEAISGLDAIAEERGWLVAYPNSAQPYWDDGRNAVGLPPANGDVDDVGYIAALADALSSEFGLETSYLAGMGVGGTMAQTIACQTPERFEAVAVVGALFWTYQAEACPAEASSPVNMLFIYGNQDHVYHEEGRLITQPEADGWQLLSATETHAHWAARNACSTAEAQETSLIVYSDCAEGKQLAFLTVEGGGNNWPRMGENQLNRFGVDASAIIGAFFGGDENWQSLTNQEALTGSLPRSYILYVPSSYDASSPRPLVVALHGRGGNGASTALNTDFSAFAEREGFLVVYPEAYDPTFQDPKWNYGLGIIGYDAPIWDDEAFLDALIDDLALSLNIDMNRLYVTGISNGGFMTERLACVRAEKYAAFAPVAATAPYGLSGLCEDTSPVPVLHIHGTADTIVPWEGMEGRMPVTEQAFYISAPMDNTMGFWAQHNGCALDFAREEIPNTDPDSSAAIFTFNDCPDSAPLYLYAVFGGGHVWPGVRDFESELLGEVNMDFNATEVIWNFFTQHSLDERSEQ
jgi:polyhydroxybutyrate depolymerase